MVRAFNNIVAAYINYKLYLIITLLNIYYSYLRYNKFLEIYYTFCMYGLYGIL